MNSNQIIIISLDILDYYHVLVLLPHCCQRERVKQNNFTQASVKQTDRSNNNDIHKSINTLSIDMWIHIVYLFFTFIEVTVQTIYICLSRIWPHQSKTRLRPTNVCFYSGSFPYTPSHTFQIIVYLRTFSTVPAMAEKHLTIFIRSINSFPSWATALQYSTVICLKKHQH